MVQFTRRSVLRAYKDFVYSRGLVKLGTIESSARVFERSGTLRVSIEALAELTGVSLF